MIPTAKPKLPSADALLTYLRQIDENRYYTNLGPLVRTFEKRFAGWVDIGEGDVVTASNGTAIMELAITALDLPPESYVILPSWTFIATAQAVTRCGFKPFFADVDSESWAITPDIVRAALKKCPGPVSLVLPVAAFGLPLDVASWEAFMDETGISVLIDAAAVSPLEVKVSDKVISTLSLHATKVLNAGEGGLLLYKNPEFNTRVREMSNFDLLHPEGVSRASGNSKMSEYHAAVALASLDEWDEVARDFMRVAKRYHENLENEELVTLRPGYGTLRFNSSCIVETKTPVNPARMADLGVAVRHSWRQGCYREPLYQNAARTDLPVSEHLAAHTTGLPCFRDLSDADIDKVCAILLAHLRENS